ncbi:hypothetical protein ACJMK2_002284 [Sinanodonta woodiana]
METVKEDCVKQELRAFLRERFLRMMGSLNGQEADIFMFEKTKVSGQIRAIDINIQQVQIADLQTPIGIIPNAVLRVSDTISLTVEDFKNI